MIEYIQWGVILLLAIFVKSHDNDVVYFYDSLKELRSKIRRDK